MSRILLAFVVVQASFLSGIVSASDFDSLAKRIPAGANAIVAIDVDAVLASGLAKANGWGSTDSSGDRPIYLPPEAEKVIVSGTSGPATTVFASVGGCHDRTSRKSSHAAGGSRRRRVHR